MVHAGRRAGIYIRAIQSGVKIFAKGEGVAKDPDAAVKWYTLAAEQGHVRSQYNLAVMYDTGDGIPEDNAAALKWYTQAADRGHIKAQYNLGLKFDNGTNVLEDDEAAFGWFKLAAEQADGAQNISWLQCMIAAKAWRKAMGRQFAGIRARWKKVLPAPSSIWV